MKAKLENDVHMDLKSSKISIRELQHETNMDPKGCPGGVQATLGVILDPPKSSKLELKFNQKSSAHLEVYFWLFGGLWGSFGARFGGHFGLHFGLPGASCHFYKK